MKATLLVFVALIALVCAAPTPCCSPNLWTADVLEWDDELDFFVIRHLAYDADNQRIRADNELHHTRTFKSSDLLFFKDKVVYRIEAGVCRKYTLSGNFNKICVAGNATFEATVTIGGSLSSNVFFYRDTQRSTYMDQLVSADGCLPLTTILVTPRIGHEFSEVWNHQATIDPTAFHIPDICRPDMASVGTYALSQKMKWYYLNSHF